jgi:N-sulfoglucosamine sulfohydrolase
MSDARPPNLLLITCHNFGRYLGCYGQESVRTPNLDALVADCVRDDLDAPAGRATSGSRSR